MKRQAVTPQLVDGSAPTPNPSSKKDIDSVRECSRKLVIPSRNREVCRFWLEKAVVVIDAAQVYGLLWQLSQPWPWPARWLKWIRWVNAANVDIFSFGATGAAMGATSQSFSLWGELQGYWVYALCWSLVPWVATACLLLAARRWKQQLRIDYAVRRLWWETILLQWLQVMYLPVGLAVIRLSNCDSNGKVSVDPTSFKTCWSSAHAAMVILVTCGLGGSFLVLLPLQLRRRIAEVSFTEESEIHERFVQSQEIAYITGASDGYIEHQLPLLASYRRHGVYTPVETCAVKLLLLVIFSLLRSPAPATSNQGLQGTLFFIVLVIVALKRSWRPPFRAQTTNQLAKITSWLLVANGFVALLCANGVRSAITVSTAVTSILTAINLSVLAAIALAFASYIKRYHLRFHLEKDASGRLSVPYSCWPAHPLMSAIVNHELQLMEWVALLRQARSTTLKSSIAPSTVKPLHELDAAITQLQNAWKDAISMDHPLAPLLHQDLLQARNEFIDAFASTPFKDPSFLAAHEQAFSTFAQRVHRLEDRDRLLFRGHRRILGKLRVATSWSSPQPKGHTRSPAFPVNHVSDAAKDAATIGDSELHDIMKLAEAGVEIDKILEAQLS